MTLNRIIAHTLADMRGLSPLIHCITNYVTAGDTANMLLAAGASPIMADDPAESGSITAIAHGLSLNLGTLSKSRLEAMLISGEEANRRGIPVVFDPVGVGCSEFRMNAAAEIAGRVRLTAIRGNLSEMSCLAGFESRENGVDSSQTGISPKEAAQAAARKLGCVCAVTGAYDVISDGDRTVVINNGTPLLRRITGAGCMTSALCAAFCAAGNGFAGTVAGIAFMDICGEIAAERSELPGSMRTALFDHAGSITPEILMERLDMHEC